MADNPDNKRKITVEQKEGESATNAAYGGNVAYINEQRQEFEIEYGQQPEK